MAPGVAPTQLDDMSIGEWFRRQIPGWREPRCDEQGQPLEYGLLNVQVPMGAVLFDMRFNMPDSKILHNETWYREVFPHGRGLVPAYRGPVLVETTDPNPSWAVLGSQLADDYEKRLVFAPPPAAPPGFEARIAEADDYPTQEELREAINRTLSIGDDEDEN